MLKFHTLLSVVMLGVVSAVAVQAESAGFDPRADCVQVLATTDAVDQAMIAAWTLGYVAARSQSLRPVGQINNTALIGNLQRICQANPGVSLLALVEAGSTPAATSAAAPGTEADARALLERFLEPGADYRSLTQALFPSEAEIRAVYADPLASALVRSYQSQMGPDVFFAPKPGHNAVLVVYTTTRALAERQPVLNEFPGGYKDVTEYFKIDVPIVRFKFVTAGETLGLAFDGLIYINGHWVIMPKPWRSLPD